MTLRIRLVTVAFLLLIGLSGYGGKSMEAVPSATPALTGARLTTSVLPNPAAAAELRSDQERAVSAASQ